MAVMIDRFADETTILIARAPNRLFRYFGHSLKLDGRVRHCKSLVVYSYAIVTCNRFFFVRKGNLRFHAEKVVNRREEFCRYEILIEKAINTTKYFREVINTGNAAVKINQADAERPVIIINVCKTMKKLKSN